CRNKEYKMADTAPQHRFQMHSWAVNLGIVLVVLVSIFAMCQGNDVSADTHHTGDLPPAALAQTTGAAPAGATPNTSTNSASGDSSSSTNSPSTRTSSRDQAPSTPAPRGTVPEQSDQTPLNN